MDVSWQLYFFTLVAISPGFLVLVAFRFIYPSYRVSPFFKSNLVAFFIASIFTTVINGRLLIAVLSWIISDPASSKLIDSIPVSPEIFMRLLEPEKCFWFPWPLKGLMNDCTLFRNESKSAVILILNFHLRALFFAVVIFHVLALFALLVKKLTNQFDVYIENIANVALHPWAVLTKVNRKRKVLMADVLTSSGLYMGMVADWHPGENNSATAIVLSLVMKFDKKESDSEKYIFPRVSDVLIPMDKVENINFWKIDKNSRVFFEISKKSDFTYLMWWLLVANEHGLRKVYFRIVPNESLPDDFIKKSFIELAAWARSRNIPVNEMLEWADD